MNDDPQFDDLTSDPGASGTPGEPASPPPGVPHHPAEAPPPGKRRWVKALLALYLVSLAAAAIIVVRSGGRPEASGDKGIKMPKVLLPGQSKEVVGMVRINGPIYFGESSSVWARGPRSWRRKIEKLAKKKEVKAIVISINSPGGSVGAVQELHRTILRMRKEHKKPFVAQLNDVAASGGYYIAIACDKVVSQPGTLLGSIGVIFSHTNIEGLMDKLGIKSKPIKSGKLKDMGSMSRPMTPEERKLLQELIDNAYGQFFKAVLEGREVPEEDLRLLADGRVFTGEQALETKMVDQLGGEWEAVQLAGKLGGIKGKPKLLTSDTESIASVLELLDMKFSSLFSPEASMLRELRRYRYAGLEYRWVQ